MGFKASILMVTIGLLLLGLSTDALGREQEPGSCLIFPYFNTSANNMTIMTITNTGQSDAWIRFVWVTETDCQPSDFWIDLTAYDTFTFVDSAIIPTPNQRGFLYAYACQGMGEYEEVAHDYLVGQSFIMEVDTIGLINFTVNAQSFKSVQIVPDGKIHLDGTEYESAASELYIPHFFAQPDVGSSGAIQSKLILINLTGGKFFRAVTRVLVFNDNEVAFSGEVDIDCWDMMDLNTLSPTTWRSYLINTNHDYNEPIGLPQQAESGWIKIYGIQAYHPTLPYTFDNPSLCAILLEGVQKWAYGADWPFQVSSPEFNNAMLWSVSVDGS